MSLIAGVTAAAAFPLFPLPRSGGGSGWGSRPHHRSLLASLALAAVLLGPMTAQAQTAPPQTAPAPTPAPATDPVVAKVNGQPIHLSDLKDAVQGLPDNLRGLPPMTLYPMLLDQMIDERALVAAARKSGPRQGPGRATADGRGGGPCVADRRAEQGGGPDDHRCRAARPL